MDQPIYLIKLRALPRPGWPPPVYRLRRALKTLLRAYGLRCQSVEEVRRREAA